MSSFEFPKQNKSQTIGYSGESFFQYFISNTLGWIYRPVHQESDLGIDGYIDIVYENCVTGKSIAVQIKCGDSYISKKSSGGIKYEGSNKHLNYYLNLQASIILIVISSNCSQGFWSEFDIENTTPSTSGWWIEIDKNSKLDITVKETWSKLAGEAQDYSEGIKTMWAISKELNDCSFLAIAIPKSDVIGKILSHINLVLKKITKNKQLILSKRSSVEIFFPEYDLDPRELYDIPEIRVWFKKTIFEGIPWFYFLENNLGMGLMVLLYCTCQVKLEKIQDNKHGLSICRDDLKWWLENNFKNLNYFTEANGISLKVNKEISHNISEWFKREIHFVD